MITTAKLESIEPIEPIVLYDVPWSAYERLLEAFGDRRFRHAYDDGVLEIMSPNKRHDRAKKLLGRMIEAACFAKDIPIQSIGSTTLRRQDRAKGLEPDECYYIEDEAAVRELDEYNPDRDPPPELAVKVDVTNSSVSRMPIYAALGVREAWCLTDGVLAFYRLNAKAKYVKIARSKALPFFTSALLEKLLAQRFQRGENDLIRELLRNISAS